MSGNFRFEKAEQRMVRTCRSRGLCRRGRCRRGVLFGRRDLIRRRNAINRFSGTEDLYNCNETDKDKGKADAALSGNAKTRPEERPPSVPYPFHHGGFGKNGASVAHAEKITPAPATVARHADRREQRRMLVKT